MPLTDLFASILGGGVTGLLGTITQRVFEFKAKKLEADAARERYAHEIELRKADAAIMAQEAAAKVTVAQTEAAGAANAADAQAFAASLTSEPQRFSDATKVTAGQMWLLVLLDVLRGSVRPVLTLYLCAVTTLIYWQARKLIATGLTPAEALDLTRLVVNTILYLCTTATLFWFGTRNSQKAPGK